MHARANKKAFEKENCYRFSTLTHRHQKMCHLGSIFILLALKSKKVLLFFLVHFNWFVIAFPSPIMSAISYVLRQLRMKIVRHTRLNPIYLYMYNCIYVFMVDPWIPENHKSFQTTKNMANMKREGSSIQRYFAIYCLILYKFPIVPWIVENVVQLIILFAFWLKLNVVPCNFHEFECDCSSCCSFFLCVRLKKFYAPIGLSDSKCFNVFNIGFSITVYKKLFRLNVTLARKKPVIKLCKFTKWTYAREKCCFLWKLRERKIWKSGSHIWAKRRKQPLNGKVFFLLFCVISLYRTTHNHDDSVFHVRSNFEN